LRTKKGVLAMTKRSIQSDDSVKADDDLKISQSVVHIPLWVSIVVIQ